MFCLFSKETFCEGHRMSVRRRRLVNSTAAAYRRTGSSSQFRSNIHVCVCVCCIIDVWVWWWVFISYPRKLPKRLSIIEAASYLLHRVVVVRSECNIEVWVGGVGAGIQHTNAGKCIELDNPVIQLT